VKEEIIDKNGKILNNKSVSLPQELKIKHFYPITCEDSNILNKGEVAFSKETSFDGQFEKCLNYFIDKCYKQENNMNVPKYLYEFVEKNLNN